MPSFVHQRHKPPTDLEQPRSLIVACPPLRSNVNLSRLIRAAGCFGVQKVIACRPFKLDQDIVRDALEIVDVQARQSLPPVLKKLKNEGFQLVGLEQATGSQVLYNFSFPKKTVLVIGHERLGIEPEILEMLDSVVEIPVYGRPLSFNVATAGVMAMYEYCRQFPAG